MTGISIGHLIHTDRPLIWRSKTSCPRCSLPFTSNESDDPVHRVPFILACQHLLCGQCVQEYATKEWLACGVCEKPTLLPKAYGNVTRGLHPSLFVLGALQQSQYELADVEAYWQSVEAEQTSKHRRKRLSVVSLDPSEVDAPQKLLSLLEKAYHSYEKSKKYFENMAKVHQENVGSVVEQINEHFVALHNALQVEENRVLQEVRQAYIERSQHNQEGLQQLRGVKDRLQDYIKQTKRYPNDSFRQPSGMMPWKKFSLEVVHLLENEPLQLDDEVRKPCRPFKYQPCKQFLDGLQSCHTLHIKRAASALKLVPFSHVTDRKARESVREESKRPETSIGFADKVVALPMPVSAATNESVAPKGLSSEKLPASVAKIESCSSREKQPTKSEPVPCKGSSSEKQSSSNYESHQKRSSCQSEPDSEVELMWRTVHVTSIVSPDVFYVQDELFTNEGATRVCELCNSEAESFECESIAGDSPISFIPGNMYLVRPSASTGPAWQGQWYRAELLAIDETTGSAYHVQYVDYGQFDTVGQEQIRPISAVLACITRGAIKCSLYEVQPIQNFRDWPNECRQLMMDVIDNQPVFMYELGKRNDGALVVELILAPMAPAKGREVKDSTMNCWKGHYAPLSLRAALIYLEAADPVHEELEHQLTDAREQHMRRRHSRLHRRLKELTDKCRGLQKTQRAPMLPEHDFFRCTITKANSPNHFHLLPVEWKTVALEPMQRQLEIVCREASTPKVYCPYEGLVCAFASTERDGSVLWLRGRVQKVLRGRCELYALDIGKREEISWSDMRLLPPDEPAILTHPLAVSCRLGHIRPKGARDSRWTRDAIAEFRQIANSGTLQFAVSIGQWQPEDKLYSVVLFLVNKTDRDTCINGLLVKNGHAECISGQEQDIQDRIRKVSPMAMDDGKSKETPVTASGDVAVADPRLPVELLKVVTPSEFYVRLCSWKTGFEQLHQAIQDHMDDHVDEEEEGLDGGSGTWVQGDVCLVFAREATAGSDPCEWHRARIEIALDDGIHYEAFLIDRAVTVRVHRTNVSRLLTRMAQIQPGAIRCRLACISPVAGNTIWHQSSLDAFRNVIGGYACHAISLDAQATEAAGSTATVRALSVVLWGMRIENQDALAPHRTVYTNLNQSLVKVGFAHLCGRFRMFATSGSGAAHEHQLLEDTIESLIRAEYERVEQFFRTVAAVTDRKRGPAPGEGGAGTIRDGNQTAQIELEGSELAEWMDANGQAAIGLFNTTPPRERKRVDEWPPAVPLEKTIFVGVATYIGSDGTIFLHDVCHQPVLERIRNVIREHMAGDSEDDATETSFTVGMPCLARFHLDKQFYRALVTQALGHGRYRVLFVDYGNVEECAKEELRTATVCGCVPVQGAQIRLSGVVPKGQPSGQKHAGVAQQWPEAVLDACHSLIVQKRCSVRVDEGGLQRIPYCTLRLLEGDASGIDVADALCELNLFVRRKRGSCGSRDQHEGTVSPVELELNLLDREPISQPARNLPDPERRDLIRWMEEIQVQYQAHCAANDQEDPNEWNSDDSIDPLNRAQLIDGFPIAEAENDCDNPTDDPRSLTIEIEDACSLPSPASLQSCEFETSSRYSEEAVAGDRFNADGAAIVELLQEGVIRNPLFHSFPHLPAVESTGRGFFAEFTNYGGSLVLYVYPHLEGHTQRMQMMAEKLQRSVQSVNDLHRWQASLLEPGAPCLAPYDDGLYYRALVEARDEQRKEATVLYVDYLNRGTVPLSDLRKCPLQLQRAPLRNVPVRLAGVRPNPRLREDDVSRRLVTVLKNAFYVKVLRDQRRESPEPTHDHVAHLVELYTDPDCTTLAYEQMFEENYFLRRPMSHNQE